MKNLFKYISIEQCTKWRYENTPLFKVCRNGHFLNFPCTLYYFCLRNIIPTFIESATFVYFGINCLLVFRLIWVLNIQEDQADSKYLYMQSVSAFRLCWVLVSQIKPQRILWHRLASHLTKPSLLVNSQHSHLAFKFRFITSQNHTVSVRY